MFFISSLYTAPLISWRSQDYHESISRVFKYAYSGIYDSAHREVQTLPIHHPDRYFFQGLIYCIQFSDFGDTNHLNLAQRNWENVLTLLADKSSLDLRKKMGGKRVNFYKGITYLHLGYVYSIRREFLKSFLQSKSGVKLLKKDGHSLEGRCAVAIYDYYKGEFLKYLDWIPFVESPNPAKIEKFLSDSISHSNYLYPFFLTPLVWMQFDKGNYQRGLNLAQDFLIQYPKNRLFRLMEADFLYKLKKYQESAVIFENYKKEYGDNYRMKCKRNCIPINYLSAVGNLIRVYHDMGSLKLSAENKTIWNSEEARAFEKWLPRSLINDLKNYP